MVAIHADDDVALSWLRQLLPRSLLGRSIMIIVTPLLLVQVLTTSVFYETHWDTVTKRLARGVAGDIATIIAMMPEDPAQRQQLFDVAQKSMLLNIAFVPGARLPDLPSTMRETLVDENLNSALAGYVQRKFLTDTRSLEAIVEIHIQLPDGVLRVEVPRRRLFSSTTYLVILWMIGSSLALFSIALLFMRSQVRPIRRLASAVEAFGKGRDSTDFRIEGASEVRQTAAAFNQMRDRVRRQIAQRTEMLAGVSHDLRTPLTRMKLALAMLGETSEVGDLKADVSEMEKMVGGYLAFARGEGREPAVESDLTDLLRDVVNAAAREGAAIALEAEPGLSLTLRPDAMRRCLANLIGNAQRYAKAIRVAAGRRDDGIEMTVDDDGPGIPPERREDVFRPFFRLEPSRNPETGGTGLGLTIARDVARSHGGDLTLLESPLGGLRARLWLPA
ncbi:MAG TPA: ATP-binding protein [Methylomirabilota bacterium]|nr:ATP-binding protein [Methylomirabilota bacterium]